MGKLKRVALFLLLLTAGFFALRLFDEGGLPATPDDPPVVEPAVDDPPVDEPETGGDPTDVEPPVDPPVGPPVEPPVEEGARAIQGITPEGRFRYLAYHESESGIDPRWFELAAKDSGRSQTDPEMVELTEFVAKLYDVETTENPARLELRGARGQVREIAKGPLEFTYENRFELEDVVADLFDGAPIVPLELTSTRAEVDVTKLAETIRSDAPVQLAGDGLDLNGTGYLVELANELVTLERDATLRVTFADQPETELTSNGRLVLSRDGERVVARATDTAAIDVPGEGGRLDAGTITLVGRHADGVYALERLDAEGDVRWQLGEQRFRGERLVLRFVDDTPTEGTLDGSPVAELLLENQPVAGLEPGEDLQTIRITVRGEKTLKVDFDDQRTEFTAVGPAIVETTDGTLTSVGDVVAWQDARETSGFRASTGVVLEAGGGERLFCDSLLGRFDPDGGESLLFRAGGDTRLDRELEGEGRLVLSTTEGVDVMRVNERWRLIEGRGVTISHEDTADAFFARADRVWDAELEGPSFTAQGNVLVRNVDGELTGDLLVFEGMESFSLEGREVEGVLIPARLVGGVGTIVARRLERRGERIDASGNVDGDLTGERLGGRLEVACDALSMVEADGEGTRTWTVEAAGGVLATWTKSDGTERTHIDCDTLTGTRTETLDGEAVVTAENEWSATVVRESRLERLTGAASFTAERLLLRTRERPEGQPLPAGAPADEYVEARGKVLFHVTGVDDEDEPFDLQGRGHQLTLDGFRRGRLVPLAGERVWATGGLRVDQVPFSLESSSIVFDELRLEATDPVLELADFRLTGGRADGATDRTVTLSARTLVATPRYLEMVDDVRSQGRLQSGAPWDFTCRRIRFEIHDAARGIEVEDLRAMFASGDVRFRLGSAGDENLLAPVATAKGARLICYAGLRTLRLEGNPAEIATPAFRTTSTEFLEFDPEIAMLIGSGPGEMSPGTEAVEADWNLRYFSSRTFVDQGTGSYITALQEPVLVDPSAEMRLRSSWLVLWLDSTVWAEMPDRMRGLTSGEGAVGGAVPEDSSFQKNPFLGRMLSFLADMGAGDLVKEVYFEGPVEADYQEAQVARTGAIYVDMVTGRGWLYDATLNVFGWMVDQDFDRLVVRTKWMRHAEDGSLTANRATVTPCDHEEPHLRIVTGDLRIKPRANDLFEVSLKDNRIELYDVLTIPLFPITYGSEDGYTPLWKTLSFGSSARFGTSATAGFEAPAGEVGEKVNDLLGGDPDAFRSKYSVDVSWLDSRGARLDLGFLAESKGNYWLETNVGGLPDTGRDRGYIRVPKSERDDLRLWYRMKSRFQLGETSWVDARVSTQTDPGVQSEFFEREFERYEERDNLVHVRSAQGPWYLDASVKKRFDSFQSDIEELPSGGVYRGLDPILELGGLKLQHTGSVRAEYLRRREGDAGLQSPYAFPDVFPDGFGEQDVARVLADQRLELPVALPLGMRFVPFVDFTFRGWDEDTTGDDAYRSVFSAGGRLAASFWREGEDSLAVFGPYLEIRTELDSWRRGTPYVFDRNETEFDGDQIRVGAYGRIASKDGVHSLEIDASAAHVSERTDSPDAWRPIEVFGRIESLPFGVPVELWHDASYDLDREVTRYSLTSFAFRPDEDLRFEVGHRRARIADDSRRLYEAATFAGVWRANEKWEFEGRQVLSLRSNEALDRNLILRRFGHDVVFEVQASAREGEGSSIGISVEPRFGWRGTQLGYVRF